MYCPTMKYCLPGPLSVTKLYVVNSPANPVQQYSYCPPLPLPLPAYHSTTRDTRVQSLLQLLSRPSAALLQSEIESTDYSCSVSWTGVQPHRRSGHMCRH